MRKKILLSTIMSCIISIELLGGCGKQANITETTQQTPNALTEKETAAHVIDSTETEAEGTADAINKNKTSKEDEVTFNYKVSHNKSTINCNIPDEWILDYENTSNAQLTAHNISNDQQLRILGATEQTRGWFDNYHATGEWLDDVWEIKLDDFSEVDTPYGKIEVATGVSSTNGFEYYLCLLYYDNTYWYIEKRNSAETAIEEQSRESVDIKEILNEIFTGKSISDMESPITDTYVEDHVNISLQGDEYMYYIEKPDWRTEGTPIINIMGFNLPEGFDEIKESEAFSDDIAWKRAYTLEKSTSVQGGSLDRIVISMSSGTYLQDYNKTNQLLEGTEYRNQYKVVSVEKKEVIDSPYGKLQIFYQVVEDIATNEQKEIETTVCYVNGEIITIDLLSKFYSEDLKGYSGEIKGYLSQMFANQ